MAEVAYATGPALLGPRTSLSVDFLAWAQNIEAGFRPLEGQVQKFEKRRIRAQRQIEIFELFPALQLFAPGTANASEQKRILDQFILPLYSRIPPSRTRLSRISRYVELKVSYLRNSRYLERFMTSIGLN